MLTFTKSIIPSACALHACLSGLARSQAEQVIKSFESIFSMDVGSREKKVEKHLISNSLIF